MTDRIPYGLDPIGNWGPQASGDDLVDEAGVKPTPKDHASDHGDGGSDEIEVETLATSGTVHSVPVAQADGSIVMELVSAGQVDSIVQEVIKASPGSISKGQAVYVVGFDVTENVPTVELAKADSLTTMPSAGTADATITDSATGNMVVHGEVSGIDTSMWSVGDDLYVSEAVAGAMKNTKPTGAANFVQKIAQVLKSDASTGIVEVFGAGRVNDIPNLASGNIWKGDGSGVPQPVAFAHKADHQHSGSDEVATVTPAANAIPKSGAGSKLDVGWVPVHASTHKHGGSDEVATATPGANAIPKANASNKLVSGWGGSANTLATLDGSTEQPVAQMKTMAAASGGADGERGVVPKPVIGDQVKFLRGDATWADPVSGLAECFFAPANAGTTLGRHPSLVIGTVGGDDFIFRIPADFGSLVAAAIILEPEAGAAGAGKDIDISSDYGAAGESRTTHQESDTASTYTLTVSQLNTIDISGILTSIAAGDLVGLQVDHNTVGGNVHYFGIHLQYTRA